MLLLVKNGAFGMLVVLNCVVLFIIITQTILLSSYSQLFQAKVWRKTETTSSMSSKMDVFLVVVVSSAPSRNARRDAIRITYWKHCHNDTKIRCFFFTDGNVTHDVLTSLKQENLDNKDMVLQPLKGGREFGLRFLHQIRWIYSRFNFTYFLRADDDYLICLDRLKHDLEHRPRRNLVWGYFHCIKNLVYVDEAWMVFTYDVIEKFLSQNESTMLCHPHADQQIAMWLNNIPSRVYFNDRRLHHYPRASHTKSFQNATNVCDNYLGIHGAYDQLMPVLYRTSNDGAKNRIPEIPSYRASCPHWGFNWSEMGGHYRYAPKLCNQLVHLPATGDRMWRGAEEGQW